MLAFAQDENLVGMADGAEAVGDDEAGAVGEQAFERFLNELFGAGVHAGGGLVEDEDGGVLEERAGDADALFFADAEFDAAFADAGIVALRQRDDEIVAIGGSGRGEELLVGGVQFAEEDVFAESAVEEEGLLADDADRWRQRFEGDSADVLPVNRDLSRSQLRKTRAGD